MKGYQSTLPVIHKTNHTKYKRVCAINSLHSVGQSIAGKLKVTDEVNTFYGLQPGVYAVDINDERFFCDIYIAITGANRFKVISEYEAYALVDDKKYMINLYKQDTILGTKFSSFMLENTVSDHIDMIMIDGRTDLWTTHNADIEESYAVMPKEGNTPDTTEEEEVFEGTLEELMENHIVWGNIKVSDEKFYKKDNDPGEFPWFVEDIHTIGITSNQEEQLDYYAVVPKDGKTIPKLAEHAASTLSLEELEDDNYVWGGLVLHNAMSYFEILLKNNIKALPNGIKDTFILNSEQETHHLIYRIGKKYLTGETIFKNIPAYSNDKYAVVFSPEGNVTDDGTNTNIINSHYLAVREDVLLDPSCMQEGVCAANTSYGRGFYFRIEKDKYTTPHDPAQGLRDYVISELETNHPVIMEYQLRTYRYRTVLIDEYHINTYYPNTFIQLNDSYDISYFYKALALKEHEPNKYDIGYFALIPKNGKIPTYREHAAMVIPYNDLIDDNIILHDVRVQFDDT